MNQAEAKEKILELWSEKKRPWEPGKHTEFHNSKLLFLSFLENNYQDLLSFDCGGDKWQEVEAWINEFEDYPNC